MPVYEPKEVNPFLKTIFSHTLGKLPPVPEGDLYKIWRDPTTGEERLPFLPKLDLKELFGFLAQAVTKLTSAPGLEMVQPLSITTKLGKLSQTPKQSGGWYSSLNNVLEQKMPNSAPVEQVMNIVKGGGVKADEMKWSGLDDYLQGKTGKVNKTELMDYLKENQVEVKEIVKRDIPPNEYRIGQSEGQGTKFSQWQLPGGKNYRELLLQLPEKSWKETKVGPQIALESKGPQKPYRSAHWDEPNVLAHVRFNDRVDAQGKKVLFIEEIQSDWHQAGREKGYAKEIKMTPEENIELNRLTTLFERTSVRGEELPIQQLDRLLYLNDKQGLDVPPAPFSKTWHEMAMRRMVRWASEHGYDKVAWTTGEQQAARYDLSKHISKIEWLKGKPGVHLTAYDLGGRAVLGDWFETGKLSETIGKEISEKIVSSNKVEGSFAGLDLKVGGEGMKGFYDKILPDYMNGFGKKWDAKVGESQIVVGRGLDYTGPEGSIFIGSEHPEAPKQFTVVHSLDITPSMKQSVLSEGLPMFNITPLQILQMKEKKERENLP